KLPPQKSIFRNPYLLEQELQRELNLARRGRRLNLAEGGRADVVIRHAKVHPVQDIEKLSAELQSRGFRQAKILGDREVPLGEAGLGRYFGRHCRRFPVVCSAGTLGC